MKRQSLFSGKYEKSVICLSSAEFAQRMVKTQGLRHVRKRLLNSANRACSYKSIHLRKRGRVFPVDW